MRGTCVLSSAEFVVNLLEEGLVEEELLFVHLGLANLDLLLLHLLSEELLVVLVDLADLRVETALLLRVVLKVFAPHVGLFVVKCLLLQLAKTLLFHLLSEVITHSLLFSLVLVVFGFVGHSFAKLFFKLVLANLFLLLSCTAVHVLNNSVGHSVHELLSSLLSLLDLIQAIMLLLVKHARIFLLSTDVFQAFSLTLCKSLGLVLLVLGKHLLKVLLLLLSLFLLKTTFSLHFFLKTFDKSDLLSVSLLLFDLAAELVLIELFVPGLLLLHNASLEFSGLLNLLLLEQLHVLVLQVLIHELFLDLSFLPRVLLLQLLV